MLFGGGGVTELRPTLAAPWTEPARFFSPWHSPGKNTGQKILTEKYFVNPWGGGVHKQEDNKDKDKTTGSL